MKYANGNAMIASVNVTAAAIRTVRNATVWYVAPCQSSRKFSSVQVWTVSDVNGSTVQNA